MDLSDPGVDADMAKRARVRSLDTKWRLPYDLVCAIIRKRLTETARNPAVFSDFGGHEE